MSAGIEGRFIMAEFPPLGRLETERLVIRPFSMADLEAARRLLDVELDWGGTPEERESWLRFCVRMAENWRNPPQGYRAVTLAETGEVIGKCGFFCYLLTPEEQTLFGRVGSDRVRALNSMALGIGYGLSRGHRGRGYATEAVRALIRFAFQELRVDALWARTTHDNQRSRALMERVGMLVGVNPDPASWPGALGLIHNPG
jgi:[ribosomal protein S5]-alanine N-acetyltransferase